VRQTQVLIETQQRTSMYSNLNFRSSVQIIFFTITNKYTISHYQYLWTEKECHFSFSEGQVLQVKFFLMREMWA